MDTFKFENQYGGHLSISGALEHFTDDICGKLGCGLEDDKVLDSNILEDYEKELLVMENGIRLEIEVYYDKKEDEWICTCREVIKED